MDGSVIDGLGLIRGIKKISNWKVVFLKKLRRYKFLYFNSKNFFYGTDSQNHFVETDKWDNHNAIARGWKTIENSYHPVTFRRIYGVCKQQTSLKNTASAPQLASSPVNYHYNDNDEQFLETEKDL